MNEPGSWMKRICIFILSVLGGMYLFGYLGSMGENTTRSTGIVYSEFLNEVNRGTIKSMTVSIASPTPHVDGERKDGSKFSTVLPPGADYKDFAAHGIAVTVNSSQSSGLAPLLINSLPYLLLIGFWIFMMRQMQAGGNKALLFGKSKARLLSTSQKKITFKDVAGCDESKEELQEIIEFLRTPKKFQQLGGRIPKGVLLVGAPGTGKTLLARAVAGEANVPFFSISGSDFVEMFVGVGASRVRDLFEQGKKNAPCIIFIDEIDAVGRQRGTGLGGGHDEREQTLNQLLVEMDGFESNEGVILVAATNRPDVLDPALLRPGRFDRRVIVPKPDIGGREKILVVHTAKLPLADNVKLSTIARGTPGFSGADLANLANEAALYAARQNRTHIIAADFENAKDKIIMGAERRSMVMSEAERRLTAWHEAGHTLVAKLTPGADPVHKVSIIPRGMALGVTAQLPIDDRYTYSKSYLLARLDVLYGGRAAEAVYFENESDITTGASNDIEQATEIARNMVCRWGMSDLGLVAIGPSTDHVFLGKTMAIERGPQSEETARQVDEAIKRYADDAYSNAKRILTEHRAELESIAIALLERETISGEDVDLLIAGKFLPVPQTAAQAPPAPKDFGELELDWEETSAERASNGYDQAQFPADPTQNPGP